jgi:transcriptional regulator with XRE-family HTH domain
MKEISTRGPAVLILDQESVGPRIAEARKLRGLTQAGLAAAVPCSKSLISQVEGGFKPATPWLVAAIARTLHTDVPSLLGQPYRGTTEHSDRVHAAIPQIRIALNYWDVPPDLEASPRPLPALRSDITAIGALLDKIDYIKLGQRLPGLIEELSGALHDSSEPARKNVAELLMYAYIAAKSMAYRLGYTDLVSVTADRAAWAARETGKPELAAYLAEERCQVFFTTGAYEAGLKFINRAYQQYEAVLAGNESGLAIAGSMRLRAAIMAARDGEHRSDAWDYLAHAREIGQRIGKDTNHYGLIFGPTNVRIHQVATAAELGDPDEAIRLAEGFRPPASLPVERSSQHYIEVSRAELLVGRRKQSLDALLRADRLAPQNTRNHPYARDTVTRLIRSHRQIPEPLRSMARRMRVEAATI